LIIVRRGSPTPADLEQFDADDQETVIKVPDAMIMKNKIQGAISPLDSHPE
jgi:hypothetical protein